MSGYAPTKNIDGLIKIIKIRIGDKKFNLDDKTFNIDIQNDASEFLTLFLNILHSEFYRIEKAITLDMGVSDISNEQSFISYIFKINYDFKIKHHGTSDTLQKGHKDYNYVKGEIVSNDYVINIKLNDSDVQRLRNPTLQKLLNFSFGKETIGKKGYEYGTVIKKFYDFPTYIMLRIDSFEEGGVKSLTVIDIPKTINISGRSYNIISVVCHNGKSASSGHYITFAERDGYWYLFNDADEPRPMCSDDVLRLISGRKYHLDRKSVV